MPSAAHTLIAFVLEEIPGKPMAKRAELYQALAELVPTNSERRKLRALALECTAVAAAHDQLAFEFLRRSKRSKNGGKN